MVPSLCMVLKKYQSKLKSGLLLLKKLKHQPNQIIQDDVDSAIPSLNDK